jgi:hypothetical protein
MRTLWCTLCHRGYASVAGDVPRICPGCDQETTWTALQPAGVTLSLHMASFRAGLNYNDRRLLRVAGIRRDDA